MEKQMDLFDQYLNDELSGLERTHFEQRLQEDEAFRSSFELHKNAIRAIEFASIKDKMSKISIEAQRSKTVGIRSVVAIAAGIALLVGAYFFTLDRVEEPLNYDQVFASIDFKDPGLPTLMGDAHDDQDLDNFMIAYKQNKYEEALEKGRTLAAKKPNSDTIQYYLAMTLYEMDQFDAASDILMNLETEPTPIGQKSEWYLYMIDLKKGDLIAAKAGIMTIAEDTSHIFRMEAIDALDVLEMTEE